MDRKDFKVIQPFEGGRYVDDHQTNDVSGTPLIKLPGRNMQQKYGEKRYESGVSVQMDDDILSKHALVVGGTGMGKTNLLKTVVKQLAQTEYDVMFIFDTKGDYYREFKSLGGYCIGKSGDIEPTAIWNIFEELMDQASGQPVDEETLYELTNEMAAMVFAGHITNNPQAFFPRTAKNIFASVLRAIHRVRDLIPCKPSNKLLKDFFDGLAVFSPSPSEKSCGLLSNLAHLLEGDAKERAVLDYISYKTENGALDGQTLGVLAELKLVADELLVGEFGKKGSFSVINAMRSGDRKCLFLEYDIRKGGVLAPIFSLLTDLAIKEAIRNDGVGGKARKNYFVIDEFKLLPHLTHMDDAVNYGRSQGARFIIGIQNISQVKQQYGEDGALNILGGFSTVIAFRASDHATREYLVDLFGENRKRTAYLSAITSRGVIENLDRGNVVEDWDIRSLQVGECIIRLAAANREISALPDANDPFFFAVDPYVRAIFSKSR